MPDQLTADALRRVAVAGARISAGRRLEDTLQAVADGVVETLGFGCAVVNHVAAGGDLEAVVVAGPGEARERLLGAVTPRQVMDRLLAGAEAWGPVRFVDHRAWVDLVRDDSPVVWVPEAPADLGPDRWHPWDALLVPLESDDGELLALLSLDLPPEGRRPDARLCELIGVFATVAGVAIANARLTEELLVEGEQLRQERQRVASKEEALRFTLSASRCGMATVSLDPDDVGRLQSANEALCRLVGFDEEGLVGRRWQDLVVPEEQPLADRRLRELALGGPTYELVERRLRRADGTRVWTTVMALVIGDGDGQPRQVLFAVDDITERKAREEVLVEQANRDHLTGLSNRRWLLGHLNGVVERARRSGVAGALVYADLDRFKEINDRHGHVAGDLALQEVAERLRSEVRSGDVVARLGGDEFVVVAEQLDAVSAAGLVERIRTSFAVPLHAVDSVVDVSVGWAPIERDCGEPADLLHLADMAMYSDKRRPGTT